MWTGATRATGIATLATGVLAAAAAGAPVAAAPPTVSGPPSYGATLTCNAGTWSADAARFDYAWAYANRGPTFADGQTWRVDQARIGYTIVCVVTARDERGGSTTEISAPVLPHKALSTLRIIRVAQHHGTLTVTGGAGPGAALAGRFGYTPSVGLQRKLGDFAHLRPIATTTAVARNGTFTVAGRDAPGRHTYVVTFTPPANAPFTFSFAVRTLTITR
jgi:hypothetical protein